MKKNIPFLIFYIFIAAVVVFNTSASLKNSLFSDINSLPPGTLVYSCDSPNAKRTLNIYRIENSLGTAVRGEIVEDGDAQNIFWQTEIENVTAIWFDNNSVVIDGLTLNVSKGGTYDCRRGKSLFQDGSVNDSYAHEGDGSSAF